MQIKNVTQFVEFINKNKLQFLHERFMQLIVCLNNFKSRCRCHKQKDKQQAYISCCNLYVDAVLYVVPKYKNTILQKIPDGKILFYKDDGTLISILSR